METPGLFVAPHWFQSRKLSEDGIVELDDERKAAMVSNLMVVLCGDRDAQPVVNAGTLYQ